MIVSALIWLVIIPANLLFYKYIKARDERLTTRGSMLKSRQIGEAADICREKGGFLVIINLGDSLELICGKLSIGVPVDCAKQEAIIKKLIREDYKRLRLEI